MHIDMIRELNNRRSELKLEDGSIMMNTFINDKEYWFDTELLFSLTLEEIKNILENEDR